VETLAVDLNGYTDLPPGRIANVVTYLEMAPPAASPDPTRSLYRIGTVRAPSPSWYRAIYRRVGDRWLWVGRAMMDDAALAAWLATPTTEILAIEEGDETIGFAELDWSVAGNLEVAMFGVVAEATGKGAAALLMQQVHARARAEGVGRIWLHTCTFDHPAAIPFYRRAGFKPYKFAIEVMPAPRLTGDLPRDAGPNIPIIEPG
jgi:GNAT superfamily N-acetyltransferase